LKWWQIRTVDFALLLYIFIYNRVLALGIWVFGMTISDTGNLALTYILDTPLSGNHPTQMLSIILLLIWFYYIVCLTTSLAEQRYSIIKTLTLFTALFGILVGTTHSFINLFEFYFPLVGGSAV